MTDLYNSNSNSTKSDPAISSTGTIFLSSTSSTSGDSIHPSGKKRSRADAFGRRALVTSGSGAAGVSTNAASDFQACPLCGKYSQKTYGRGRGMAAHLQAVHTPWKPSKLARKISRRQWEEGQRRRGRRRGPPPGTTPCEPHLAAIDAAGLVTAAATTTVAATATTAATAATTATTASTASTATATAGPTELTEYVPTQQERDDWEALQLTILQSLEAQLPSRTENTSGTTIRGATTSDTTTRYSSVVDRSGKPLQSYKDSLPPFLQAASEGELDKLTHMIAESTKYGNLQQLLDQTDRHGSSAEHWAAGGGHLECLKRLLANRRACRPPAHESQERQQTKDTTFNHDGSVQDDTETEAGAPSSSSPPPPPPPSKKRKARRRRDGKTCLHYAARNGRMECVQYLVEEESFDITEKSGEGSTAFHMACYGGHLTVIQYFVSRPSLAPEKVAHTPNDWGCTAAHWVAMTISKDCKAIQDLCSYLQDDCGVDFGAIQQQGHSPLHKAAHRLNEPILRWMTSPRCRLSKDALDAAAAPDHQGGHRPSDIWRYMGGEEGVAEWMTAKGW